MRPATTFLSTRVTEGAAGIRATTRALCTQALYTQAAGFLRVVGGDEALDATEVHPESYELARTLMGAAGISAAAATAAAATAPLWCVCPPPHSPAPMRVCCRCGRSYLYDINVPEEVNTQAVVSHLSSSHPSSLPPPSRG